MDNTHKDGYIYSASELGTIDLLVLAYTILLHEMRDGIIMSS